MGFIDFLKGLFGALVGQLFKSAAATTVGSLAEGIAAIAAEVVQDLENGDLLMNGAEKRAEAFTRIKAKAIEEGKLVTTHAINIAIELALAVITGAKTNLPK